MEEGKRKSLVAVTTLKPDDFPTIPEVERISVARKKIASADWRNRHFKDLNGLATEFEGCDFRYSIFERAYFRDAQFNNCRFDGAIFIECNFKNSNIYRCDFKFAHFRRCELDVREFIASLPPEPNIRRDSLRSLKANALEVGDYSNVKTLVLQEIEATKRHFLYAVRGFDSYYRKKYPTLWDRLKAGLQLAWLNLEGLVWGHGEKPWRLLASCLIILCCLTTINFWSVMPRVSWGESRSGLNILKYVIDLFLDMSPDVRFKGYLAVDYIIVLMRYVYIGLFISVLYKRISHR